MPYAFDGPTSFAMKKKVTTWPTMLSQPPQKLTGYARAMRASRMKIARDFWNALFITRSCRRGAEDLERLLVELPETANGDAVAAQHAEQRRQIPFTHFEIDDHPRLAIHYLDRTDARDGVKPLEQAVVETVERDRVAAPIGESAAEFDRRSLRDDASVGEDDHRVTDRPSL